MGTLNVNFEGCNIKRTNDVILKGIYAFRYISRYLVEDYRAEECPADADAALIRLTCLVPKKNLGQRGLIVRVFDALTECDVTNSLPVQNVLLLSSYKM